MNSALQKVCGKNKTLPSFLKELKNFIKTQENQISLAIVQQGHLRLKEKFRNLEVPISTWATWDPSERKKHISKVNNYTAKAQESCSRIYTPLEVTNDLSSSPDSCGITDVQENIIKDILEKAERLLQKEFSIVSIPEYPDARREDKCKCHLNKLHKICHHVLAVAENAGVSDDYLQWRQKKKTTPSLSLAVNTTLPKSAGRKPNKKRGWAKKKATCTKPSDLSVIDPFHVDTENNFIFRFLENTRIMVCYGCEKRFRSSTAEVPNPPFDIVLAKKE
ncbi:unnamed protein product [Mytilus coruscus]|uniref:SWIM-type domain-containing protein n=1 Tax=Mytilus coruscus TaxID=42192 RepID=A0A6J8BCJ6_MYTCO|nr:unnamed protein product [Mytilus coruscus]